MRSLFVLAAAASALTLAACQQSETTTAEAPAADAATGGEMTTPTTASVDAMTPAANPTVGGAEMLATRNIVENAANSPVHRTLVAAVTQAQLGETLSGAGPFTVFAPTDEAFNEVPAAARESLMQDANRTQLQGVLTYHVVPGRLTAADLTQQITAGGGTATLTTVQGATLTARAEGGGIVLTDGAGNQSRVTTADVIQSNGVIHVVDNVLMMRAG